MPINFDGVSQAGAKCAQQNRKTQAAHIVFLSVQLNSAILMRGPII